MRNNNFGSLSLSAVAAFCLALGALGALGATAEQACPYGQVRNADNVCQTCGAGTVKVPDNNYGTSPQCVDARTACGTNQVAVGGSCKPCTYGQVGATNTECAVCPAGKAKVPDNNYATNAVCTDARTACGTNQVAVGGSCKPCTYGQVGATNTECAVCPAGKAKVPDNNYAVDAVCIDARPTGPVACGTNQVAEAGRCKPCTYGKVASSSIICDVCPVGRVKIPDNNYAVEAQCINARYGCGTNQVAFEGRCKPCTYGQVAISDTECGVCPAGKVKVPDNNYAVDAVCSSARVACGTNQIAVEGRCMPCTYGQVAVSDTECGVCPEGKVKVPDNNYAVSSECKNAREGGCGTNQIAVAGRCQACPNNQVPVSNTQCGPCEAGKVKSPNNNYAVDAECMVVPAV